jgi:hypothetical protein
MDTTQKEEDNIFIVEVCGSSSKTINIPDEVCKFCNITHGDLIKLKILDKKANQSKKKT